MSSAYATMAVRTPARPQASPCTRYGRAHATVLQQALQCLGLLLNVPGKVYRVASANSRRSARCVSNKQHGDMCKISRVHNITTSNSGHASEREDGGVCERTLALDFSSAVLRWASTLASPLASNTASGLGAETRS